MDFRQIPEVSLSLRAVTSRDLRFLGRRGRVRGLPGLHQGNGARSPALLPPQSPPKKAPCSRRIPFQLNYHRSPAHVGGGRCGSARGEPLGRWASRGGTRAACSPPRGAVGLSTELTDGAGAGDPRQDAEGAGLGGPAGTEPLCRSRGAAGQREEKKERKRRRRRSGSSPVPLRARHRHHLRPCHNWSWRAAPSLLGPARGKVRPVLTEDAVLLQGAVDLAVGVDLQVVLGGTEELPAPGRSPQVLVDAAAAPRIPARPGVAGGGSGRARGARLLPQAQEQDPNYEHCGMMAAASSLLGRRRLGASGTGGPIRDVSLAARRAGEARSGPGGEASASSYRPRSGPFICLRFT